jgi:hypothetical protein
MYYVIYIYIYYIYMHTSSKCHVKHIKTLWMSLLPGDWGTLVGHRGRCHHGHWEPMRREHRGWLFSMPEC